MEKIKDRPPFEVSGEGECAFRDFLVYSGMSGSEEGTEC